jgi:23S rRNA (cytosine1962-C5)-methyltransferase
VAWSSYAAQSRSAAARRRKAKVLGGAPLDSLLVPFRPERVLRQGGGLLVINKPPGLVVHGGDAALAGDLIARLGTLLRQAGQDGYLGVHSRLDVGTSGVLPFTTERERNLELAAEIERGAERVYWAAVSLGARGRLSSSGVLEHQLVSDKRRARVVGFGGDPARTAYRVLKESGSRALLELRPETGRMHQLRVQLAAAGTPIAGDELYGGAPAWRLLLHCRARTVLGERFEAPPPPELEAWVATGSSFASLLEFRQRLLDAACLRFPLSATSNVMRLVNEEGDGLPGVTIDSYAEHAVLSVASPAAEAVADSIARCLMEHGVRGVYVKRRERRDVRRAEALELAPAAPLAGAPVAEALTVAEGALEVRVDLADGLSTGLFVDQRDNRRRVLEAAAGNQVLNLFAYTCSFSVAAAMGGAARVTSVDLSGRALERGKQNFRVNGLDPERHEFVQTDAVRFVKGAVKHGRRFDLIVLDPPSFATVGKATFRFERDIEAVMSDCLRLLSPAGSLLCVTNHKKTSQQALRRFVQAAGERARLALKVKDLPSGLDCPPGLEGPSPSKSVLATLVVTEPGSAR